MTVYFWEMIIEHLIGISYEWELHAIKYFIVHFNIHLIESAFASADGAVDNCALGKRNLLKYELFSTTACLFEEACSCSMKIEKCK